MVGVGCSSIFNIQLHKLGVVYDESIAASYTGSLFMGKTTTYYHFKGVVLYVVEA